MEEAKKKAEALEKAGKKAFEEGVKINVFQLEKMFATVAEADKRINDLLKPAGRVELDRTRVALLAKSVQEANSGVKEIEKALEGSTGLDGRGSSRWVQRFGVGK